MPEPAALQQPEFRQFLAHLRRHAREVADGTAAEVGGGIVALDMQGEIQWMNHDIQFYSRHGLGASPILHDDLLIMPFDGSSEGEDSLVGLKKGWEGAVILSLDKTNGKVVWKGKRGLSRLAHVTPQILDLEGKLQLVSAAGDAIQGHDLATGDLVWTVFSQGEGVTPSIVLAEGLIYTCSGFEAPTIRVVRPGGSGDVTESHIAWEQTQGVPALSSLAYVAPHIYAVTDTGIVNCFDAKSGESVWQKRMGGKHSSSPVVADGLIYFLSEIDGETIILRPGTKYDEVGRCNLGATCKASMAVSRGNLFIRSDKHLFCIGEKPKK